MTGSGAKKPADSSTPPAAASPPKVPAAPVAEASASDRPVPAAANGGPTISYLDPFRDARGITPLTAEERAILRQVNHRIAAKPGLEDVINYLFDETQALIPCDRMSFSFVQEGGRVTSEYTRASYEPLYLQKGYSELLQRGSLKDVLRRGMPRIIGDLERYLADHPRSSSSRLLVKEGVRSSLTCPLQVEGRVVGFMFRSSRTPNMYKRRHVELQMSITERLSQAVEKAWRIEQLEHANHAYMELLGFVSHELKSPLASLVTDARLLTGGYLGEMQQAQHDKVERIAQKGEYLIDLIREYLDLSYVEGGELRLRARTDVHLREDLVLPALELLRAQLETSGMRICVKTPPEDVTVACDPGLLRIALTNYIGNAIKYGRPGGAIWVSATVGEGEFTLAVWNEGPGFSADQRSKLYARFSRLMTPESRKVKGTGLGLYNTLRIIQLHHGRVAAESEEGAWAEFSFTIPQPLPAASAPVSGTEDPDDGEDGSTVHR